MIFFRKIHYLSFIHTRTVCSCILFPPRFVHLEDTFGGNCWHKKVPFFAILQPPKTLKTPQQHRTLGLHSTHTKQQHPHNNNNRRLQQQHPYQYWCGRISAATIAPPPILFRDNKCSNLSTPTNILPRHGCFCNELRSYGNTRPRCIPGRWIV